MRKSLTLYLLATAFSASAAPAAYVASGDVLPADPAVWTSSTSGYVGKTSTGVLTVDGGSPLLSQSGCLGYAFGSTGSATVDGSNTTWTSQNDLIVGNFGAGTLQITNGGRVVSDYGYQGYFPGSTGTVTVDGAGSSWTNGNYLYTGLLGPGILNITNGARIDDAYGYLGYYFGGTGSAMVDGAGSNWTNSGGLYVGAAGTGTLDLSNGGQVDNAYGYLGYDSGSQGSVAVDGPGSRWTCHGSLYVGVSGGGTLNITNGGRVADNGGYVGYNSNSTGNVTLDGDDASWTNSGSLHVGSSGTGSVVQSGGTVSIDGALCLGDTSAGKGAYDLSGGTLILKSLAKGGGTATFRFGGGTLQAGGPFTSSLPLMLTGGDDANVHTNGYDVVFSGALSGLGGLKKLGDGTLTLGALGTYSGETTIRGGTLAFSGGIGAGGTKRIDVEAGKALLSATNVNMSDLDVFTEPEAFFEVANATHVLGEISGSGTTLVESGACLTAASITQGALIIGSAPPPGAAPVPEPGLIILLITAFLALIVYIKRRNMYFSCST